MLAPEDEFELLEEEYRQADRRVESLERARHDGRAGEDHEQHLRRAYDRRAELARELDVARSGLEDEEDRAA